MSGRFGYLTIQYSGTIPKAFEEHLAEAQGLSVTSVRPLVLGAERRVRAVNRHDVHPVDWFRGR